MNLPTSLKLRKLFITMLSVLLAFCMIFTCACSDVPPNEDGNDDDTETEATIEDAQILNNGDFEFYTTDKTVYPYSSSIKWTRVNDSDQSSAPTSSYSSGIIDVNSTAYATLNNKNKPVDTSASGTETVYLNPQTPYYYGLIENKYDSKNVETHANPNTSGSKILMIHNKLDSTPNHGTAQFFTSSTTLTVAKSSYAKLSVWVKTQDLASNQLNNGEFGAYVLLTNTVNNNAYNNIVFNNIDTKGQWSLLETYIVGDELFDSTFKVVLGLGQGNGTNHQRFVEGFAYFDNLTFETFTKKEFDALTKPSTAYDVTKESRIDIDLGGLTYVDNGDAKPYDAQNTTYYTTNAYLINYSFIPNYDATQTSDANSSYNTSVLPSNFNYDLSNGNKIGAGSYNSVKSTLSTASQNALTSIEDDLGVTNPNLIYFDFANTSTASHTIDNLVIKSKSYIRYSFFSQVKITNNSSSKFKVEVIDNTNQNNIKKTAVFSSIGTTNITNGNYGNWIKYDIYVANVTDADVNYALKFTFGIDEGKIAQINADLTKGYAFIADLKSFTTQTEEDFEKYDELYSSLATSNTIYKINLTGNYSAYEDETEEAPSADSYSILVDLSQQFEITKNPVTNIDDDYKLDGISQGTTYGIFNTKYIDNYPTTINIGDRDYIKNTLASDSSLQLLMLNNTVDTDSYYETYKSTVEAGSVLKIGINLAVTGNSKAYVNFLIKNDNGLYDLASISGNEAAWAETLTLETTAQDFTTLGQKFLTLTMYVATGNRAFDYKLQIGNKGLGAVYVQRVSISNSDASAFVLDQETLKDDFASITGLEFTEKEYTRADATVKSLDENGNEVTSTRTFEPTTVYAGNNLYKFIDYTTTFVENEIDETNVSETPDEEESTTPEDPVYVTPKNLALEIISIILSIVLLGVLVTVLVRNMIKRKKDKLDTTKTYYSRDSREKALNAISDKKKRINVEQDDEEYDYTLAEKVGDEDEVTEEVIDLDTLTQAPIDDSEVAGETPSDDATDGDTPTDSE